METASAFMSALKTTGVLASVAYHKDTAVSAGAEAAWHETLPRGRGPVWLKIGMTAPIGAAIRGAVLILRERGELQHPACQKLSSALWVAGVASWTGGVVSEAYDELVSRRNVMTNSNGKAVDTFRQSAASRRWAPAIRLSR